MCNYANPDMLVTTEWVALHRADALVRLLEVDIDTCAYEQGHIAGAVGVNWASQLCDEVCRDVLDPAAFEQLCRRCGISNEHTVVFYGDHANWFAAYALWQFRYHGHPETQLRLMNGGRSKWMEEGRPLECDTPAVDTTVTYDIRASAPSVRAFKEQVAATIQASSANLVDVRTSAEYTGDVIAPPGMNETALRGGHIPGAVNVPWADTLEEDGTFKQASALRALYAKQGLDMSRPTITYCRIGERAAHSWFVLTYLLGLPDVSNYDGSWTEWGNLIGAPIARG